MRAGTEARVDDNTEHDTRHDMHYEHHDFDDDFRSCSSTQENEGHQVFLAKAAVKQLAKDGLDFSPGNHAGEQAAKEAFEKRQFTPDKFETSSTCATLMGPGASARAYIMDNASARPSGTTPMATFVE